MPVEFVVTLAILGVGLFWRRGTVPLPRGWSRRFRRLGRRRWLAPLSMGAVTLLLNVALSVGVHWPEPAIQDEFAYLLGADTFAHGRLTNPSPRFFEHFETYHVLVQPTYQMKYPPGQSLALAVGQRLGHPLVGAWLSLALAMAALCWMLQAWLPPRWSVGGTLLILLNSEVLRWWGQTYWGGAVAMLGGALVYGALPRLRQRPRAGLAAVLALGLVILANTRPYEGLLLSVPAAVMLLLWLTRREGSPWRESLGRIIAPVGLILGLAAAGMAYYNYRVTGDVWRLPYVVYHEQYSGTRGILGLLSAQTPVRDGEPELGSATRTDLQPPPLAPPEYRTVRFKLVQQWRHYVRFALSIPLCMLLVVRPDRRTLVASAVVLIVLLPLAFPLYWGFPHYSAPATALIAVLLVRGLRLLRGLGRLGHPAAGRLFALIVLTIVPLFLAHVANYARRPCTRFCSFGLDRAEFLATLQAAPGDHLVFVRYAPHHDVSQEWVYNESDLDAARIVWARELSAAENRRLQGYYAGRTVWLVEADADPPRLRLYRQVNEAADR